MLFGDASQLWLPVDISSKLQIAYNIKYEFRKFRIKARTEFF
jgi:hypothetical protein